MARREPHVITGARGPSDARPVPIAPAEPAPAVLEAPSQAKVAAAVASRKSHLVRLHSRQDRLWLQLTSPKDRADPGTGQTVAGDPLHIRFESYRAQLDLHESRDLAKWFFIVGSEAFDASHKRPAGFYFPDFCSPRSGFGLGGNFWTEADEVIEVERRKFERVLDQLAASPELVAHLEANLGKRDFKELLEQRRSDIAQKRTKRLSAAVADRHIGV